MQKLNRFSPVDDIFGDFTSADASSTPSSVPTQQQAPEQAGKKSNADILALFGASPAAAPNPMQGFGQMNQSNQFGGMNPMAQQHQGFQQQGFPQQSMSPMGLPQQSPFGNQTAFAQQQAYNPMQANPMQMGQMNNLGMFPLRGLYSHRG